MVVLLSILYILQLIILLIRIVIAKIEEIADEDNVYPSFAEACILMFVPLGFIPLLLIFLYKNDKNKL